jgi:mono/diheme cytochrome c family protein
MEIYMGNAVWFCRHIGIVVLSLLLFSAGQLLASEKTSPAHKKMIERGKYLVTVGGCNDCHSPKVYGPAGPFPDTTLLLSGARANQPVPEIPEGLLGPGKWAVVSNGDFTTWAGPWGVSFAKNLTPDTATGLGSWTEEMFINALRKGKDMGQGRDILPPMPWQNFAQMTDDDLRAVFAYLHSLKPVENAVHDPIPPPSTGH